MSGMNPGFAAYLAKKKAAKGGSANPAASVTQSNAPMSKVPTSTRPVMSQMPQSPGFGKGKKHAKMVDKTKMKGC